MYVSIYLHIGNWKYISFTRKKNKIKMYLYFF